MGLGVTLLFNLWFAFFACSTVVAVGFRMLESKSLYRSKAVWIHWLSTKQYKKCFRNRLFSMWTELCKYSLSRTNSCQGISSLCCARYAFHSAPDIFLIDQSLLSTFCMDLEYSSVCFKVLYPHVYSLDYAIVLFGLIITLQNYSSAGCCRDKAFGSPQHLNYCRRVRGGFRITPNFFNAKSFQETQF